eukprot:1011292-Amphidinium_carterae.1
MVLFGLWLGGEKVRTNMGAGSRRVRREFVMNYEQQLFDCMCSLQSKRGSIHCNVHSSCPLPEAIADKPCVWAWSTWGISSSIAGSSGSLSMMSHLFHACAYWLSGPAEILGWACPQGPSKLLKEHISSAVWPSMVLGGEHPPPSSKLTKQQSAPPRSNKWQRHLQRTGIPTAQVAWTQ